MEAGGDQHVFVSYVREDSDRVDNLCGILGAAGIPYWRDRKNLDPGDAWKAKIRAAIQGGSLVFLACFSDNSRARAKSQMNEELTIVREEFRKMPPGRTWLIPVRFDDGEVPEWDLGAGRMLSDLNYADLFGEQYGRDVASLVTTIARVLGGSTTSPELSLAAVAQAHDEQRIDLLRRITKEMLPDPARRITLDDHIGEEARRIGAAFDDTEQFPTALSGTTATEQFECIVHTSQRYWAAVKPFCASLQVAARWAQPTQLDPWISGLRLIAGNAIKIQSGQQVMIDLTHLPMVAATYTAAIACTANRRWDNIKALLVDAKVRDPQSREPLVSLLDVSSPWDPFQNNARAASIFARSAINGESVTEAFAHFEERNSGYYFTPIAEWARAVLRPLFVDQLPRDDDFETELDRAEAILGILSQDEANRRQAARGPDAFPQRASWFGRSTWRAKKGYPNPVAEFSVEFEQEGSSWGPLRAGLFGSNPERARAAIDRYAEGFASASKHIW